MRAERDYPRLAVLAKETRHSQNVFEIRMRVEVVLAGKMATTLEQLNCEDFIRDRIESKHTHQDIAAELQQMHPNTKGLSARSIRRFCAQKNIHFSSRLTESQVDQAVESAVAQVTINLSMHACD